MTCPMCGAEAETERLSVDESVYVFCCDRCITGVLRTFAAHDPDQGPDGATHDEVA